MENNFYVITPIFNPAGFKSRLELYNKFKKFIASCGAKLITIELQYGELPFEVTEDDNPNHIQVRTASVLWHKENLINLAASRLPSDWKYLAWIDADISFVNDNWMYDTCRALQFHPVVQMFAQALDLSSSDELIQTHEGIGFAYQTGLLDVTRNPKSCYSAYGSYGRGHGNEISYRFYHPGFAWAMRRETFDALGGLLDFAALGSADHHMSQAFIGNMETTVHNMYSENFKKKLREWQSKSDKVVKRNLGYVPGSILHYWHGAKKDRGYTTRYNILIEHGFDPDIHLEKDWQGLYRWADRDQGLHYDIYRYFLSRKEDQLF